MKQRAFCDRDQSRASWVKSDECYMQVYDVSITKTGKIPKHAHVDCSRLMANPSVSLHISNGLKRLETNAVASTTRTRSYVLEQLMRESKEADSDSTRVRALELLGKTVNLFSDTLEIKESRTSDDIESEIEDMTTTRSGEEISAETSQEIFLKMRLEESESKVQPGSDWDNIPSRY